VQQISKYEVLDLGTQVTNILSEEDSKLVPNFTLNSTQFIPNKYRLGIGFYTLDGTLVQYQNDIRSYSVLGSVRDSSVDQIFVNPVTDSINAGYQGDVIVEYEVFNDMLNTSVDGSASIYISEFSTDRTELRLKSTNISDNDLKYYVDNIYQKLNNEQYFSEVYLEVGEERFTVVNIMTEVVNSAFYVTVKLYEPLSANILLKSQGTIVERIGEPVKFQVTRKIENIPDPVPTLKGPNFNIDLQSENPKTTEYLNYDKLLSYYPVSSSYYQIYNLFGQNQTQISVDHNDYSSFIHFSSAAERLANFRYKFELILSYEESASFYRSQSKESKAKEYEELAEGVIKSFDHYEKFLYYESGSHCWPKKSSQRPYENEKDWEVYTNWYDIQFESASVYDIGNKDILIGTIPFAIREDSRNEAYIMFIHMIGQHFDEEWMYAKAISDRYNGDNRMNFGISKDLVREAIQAFGINLYETNQNLDEIFSQCRVDGTFDVGAESGSLEYLSRITVPGTEKSGSIKISELKEKGYNSLGLQPIRRDDYIKEVYKRIYHNIPSLIKTKGTQRGLRTLINCFGIPDDILEIKVLGGTNVDEHNYGPREGVTSSIEKVRQEDIKVEGDTLSLYTTIQRKNHKYSDDSHEIEVGFNVSKGTNEYLKSKLPTTFDYDDLIGDPRNLKENYGDVFDTLRKNILKAIKDPKYNQDPRFRTPAGIIYFIKYFDSMLFRSLVNFIPAKANVHVGAIVEDNILHRNRYKGVDLEVRDLDYSGSIKTGFITGSNNGSFDEHIKISGIEGERYYETDTRPITRSIEPTTNYTRSLVDCSTKFRKDVFDESPKYTGELSGSQYQVITGELNDENILKKGQQPSTMYGFNIYYLDLLVPNFCKVLVDTSSYFGTYFNVRPLNAIGIRTISSSYCETDQVQDIFINFTETSSLNLVAESSSDYPRYIGWQKGTESIRSCDPEYLTPRTDYSIVSSSSEYLSATYNDTELDHNRLLLWVKPGDDVDPTYYYDYQLVLDWKVEQNVLSVPGNIDVLVQYVEKVTGNIYSCSIEISAIDILSTQTGSRVIVEIPGGVKAEDVTRYGAVTMYDSCKGPFEYNDEFWDADWYETYDSWQEERRTVDEF